MTPPTAAATTTDPPWRTPELLPMSEVMRPVGQSRAPEVVLREMLHLLSELLGLNRGRIVLADGVDVTDGAASGAPQRASAPGPSSIRYACGRTRHGGNQSRAAQSLGLVSVKEQWCKAQGYTT